MVLNNKAAVFIEMNQISNAIDICKEALVLAKEYRISYEDKAKIYQRIASAHLKAGNDSEAIEAYKSAQMENFDKAIDRKMKNLELEMKKRAIAAYIDPEKGLEAKERGNTAFRDGNFADAIKEYEEAIKRDPNNASYRNNLAATLLKVGDFIGAKNSVEKALEIDKTYVKAWAKKGDIEFFMKGFLFLLFLKVNFAY
jgi:stress-induced-phosphoprotein 1